MLQKAHANLEKLTSDSVYRIRIKGNRLNFGCFDSIVLFSMHCKVFSLSISYNTIWVKLKRNQTMMIGELADTCAFTRRGNTVARGRSGIADWYKAQIRQS